MKTRLAKFRKAFTLSELLIAVAIVVLMVAGTTYIFKVALNAQKTASATAEIMRNLRALTDQIDADFKGLRRDYPIMIRFEQLGTDSNDRFDQIMFFADGDFSTYNQWPLQAADPVQRRVLRSSAARIYYGQARCYDGNSIRFDMICEPTKVSAIDRGLIPLARNQHVLTNYEWTRYGDYKQNGDPNWPDPTDFAATFHDGTDTDFNSPFLTRNNYYEYDKMTLSQWRNVTYADYSKKVAPFVFDNKFRPAVMLETKKTPDNSQTDPATGKPFKSLKVPATFPNLLCRGVGTFRIQWPVWDNTAKIWRWGPSGDRDEDGQFNTDTDFQTDQAFGSFFNIVGDTFAVSEKAASISWYPIDKIPNDCSPIKDASGKSYYSLPRALKFTFTLYDSKGVFKKGKTFTHIVYLGDK